MSSCSNCLARPFSIPGGPRWIVDASLEDLRRALRDDVRFYVVRTIRLNGAELEQHGSAPNFAGGFVTLCTCKHRMRAARSPEQWIGTWLAGFSGKSGSRPNYQVYLMRIGWAFASQRDLWQSKVLPRATKLAKVAQSNPQGDLFEYRAGDPLSADSYEPPCPEHSHAKDGSWRKDIEYHGGRHSPALLVGDPKQTFVWQRPRIQLTGSVGRGHRGPMALSEFLALLTEAP